jgi:hypothetical protein
VFLFKVFCCFFFIGFLLGQPSVFFLLNQSSSLHLMNQSQVHSGVAAEALTDPLSNIHSHFVVVFAKKHKTLPQELVSNNGAGSGAEDGERGLLLSAPSAGVRQVWVDAINGRIRGPVGEGYLDDEDDKGLPWGGEGDG